MIYYSNLQENENLNHDNIGFAQSFEATKDCALTCMILGAYTGPHFGRLQPRLVFCGLSVGEPGFRDSKHGAWSEGVISEK